MNEEPKHDARYRWTRLGYWAENSALTAFEWCRFMVTNACGRSQPSIKHELSCLPSDFVITRNLRRPVLATPVRYNHLVLCSLLQDSIEHRE